MGERTATSHAEVDISLFPLVVLTERGTLSDEERVSIMEALEGLVERRGRHALVIDLARGAIVPASQRTYIAEALQLRTELFVQKWAAVAVVVSNPVVTHLPKAAFWLKVLPVPARMFADRDDAMAWARSHAMSSATGAIPTVTTAEAKRRVGR